MKRLITAAIAAFFMAAPVNANPKCGQTSLLYESMKGQFGGTRITAGIASNGLLIEIWANKKTGIWIAIVSAPNGMSCVLENGHGFVVYDEESGEPS